MAAAFDSGLQPERTSLAWQRTLLSLAMASIASGRGFEPLIGALSWVIAGAGVAVSILGFVLARRRYLDTREHITRTAWQSLPYGGALVTIAAALCVVAGAAALVFAVSRSA